MAKKMKKKNWMMLLAVLLMVLYLLATSRVYAAESLTITNEASLPFTSLLSYTAENTDAVSYGGVSVNASTGVLTLTAKGYKATRTSYTSTTTVTITAIADLESVYFTFTQTGSGGSVSTSKSSGTSLNQGSSITFSVTSPSGSGSATATLTISSATLKPKQIATTFVAPVGGSYTVDGNAITASTTNTQSSTVPYSLSATAASGYTFTGWCDDAGRCYSTSATYSYDGVEDHTIWPLFQKTGIAMYYVAGSDDVYYQYLDSAINAAGNSKTVVVYRTGEAKGSSSQSSFTIPNGVTLLVPFDDDLTVYTTEPEVVYGAHSTPSAFRTLTLNGVSITVANGGKISVSSKLCATGTGSGSWNGTPTGPGGRIAMENNSSITLQSGAGLYCYGYISGSGTVTANSGSTVYEAMQFRCWRGGTATSGMTSGVFPMNQYYIQNIEVPLTIYSGANEYIYTAANMSSTAYPASTQIIGASAGMFRVTDGYIVKTYDGTNDRLIIDIYGDMTINNLSIKMAGTNVNSSSYNDLPITNNMSIRVHSGTVSSEQKLAFLAGTELVVDDGANVALSSNIYIYDQDEWGSGYFAAPSCYVVPVGYSVANGTATKRAATTKPVDAKFDINGTLTVSGKLYTTAGGANITSSLGTGKVVLSSAPTATTTTQQATQSNTDITRVTINCTAAKLHNGDGTYTETAGAAAGTTFYYCKTCDANGRWETEHTVTKADPTAEDFTFIAPSGLTYSGAAKAATVEPKSDVTGMGAVTVRYYQNGTEVSAANVKNVGTYTVKIDVAEGDSYNSATGLTDSSWTFTITKANSSVTTAPTAKTLTYNGSAQALVNAGAATGGSMQYCLTQDGAFSATIPTGTNAGSYTVYYKVVGDQNHNDTAVAGPVNVTIGRKALTVTAKPKTITYGDAPANDGVTYSGFVNSETASVLGGTLGYDYSYTQYGDVGNSYTITPKGLTSDNYAITFTSGTMTVAQREVTITWGTTIFTYDKQSHVPTATATGLVNNDAVSVTVTGAQTNAGSYTATASGLTGAKAGNYALPSAKTQSFTINKKGVTITGLSASNKTYDGSTTANVTGTATISGLVSGDTVTVKAGTAAFADKNVGNGKTVTFTGYSLQGTDAGNYTLSAQPASVTASITAKSVTVSGITAESKTYDGGTSATLVTSGASFTGIVSGDTLTVTATGTFDNKNVGTGKTVTISGLTLGGSSAGNYVLAASGHQTTTTAAITAKSVTITGPSAYDKVYDGTTTATVTGTAIVSDVVDGDNVTVTEGTASFADANAGAGKTVSFTGYGLGGVDAINYTLSAQPASVTADITKANLTITAKPKTITYGDAPANGGVSYDGFAANEDERNLTGTLSYTYNYSQYGDVGTYIITPGGLSSSNYTISFVDGILTVEKKEVGLTWGNTELTYTGEAQVPTAELTGRVNDDDVRVSVAGAMTDVGTGEATASLIGAKACNYKLPETNTTSFSITAAEMAVSAAGYTGTYDGADHGITVTAPDGATVTYSNAESGTYGKDNLTYADAGVYTVYYKVEKANYTTVTGSAAVQIGRRAATVTADAKGKTYGEADPALTATVEGLVGSDTVAYTIERAAGENVDTYAITPTGEASQGNYAVTFVPGTLTITKRNVTLTSASQSKEYDGTALTNSTVTVGGDGWADGEGATYNVTGAQKYVGSSANTFTYSLNEGTLAGNYTITKVEGTLEVTTRTAKYEIDVVANSGEFLYDGTEKTVSGFDTLNFTFNGVTYTVSGLSASVSGTDAGTYTVAVSGTPVVKDGDNNVLTDQFIVNSTPGTLTINARSVTLTSATDTKVYDGRALTNHEVTVTGDGFIEGEGASYNVTGSQKIVGSSSNTFTYALNEGTLAGNYNITVVLGTLSVTSRTAKYEISPQANSGEFKYDGAEKTVTGFVTNTFMVEGNTYTVSGLTATGSGTNAGTYTVAVSGTAVVRDSDGSDVTSEFSVTPISGTLTITKRSVTLTSATDTKEYDGDPLTNDTVTATGDGFAAGEGATYDVTGTRTLVGSAENAFTYELNGNTKAGNYNITTSYGTLTVNNRNTQYAVTLVGNSDTVMYDGTTHTVTGWTINDVEGGSFTASNGKTYTVEGMTATASGINAGTYTVNVTGTPVVKDSSGNDVTAQFAVTTESGTLTITKRSVTLTSASQSKEYDGTALTNDTVTVTGDGFATGEGATCTVTGSQTLPGESANAFNYTLNEGTIADNYNITTETGTLTISDRTDKYEITVTANSGEYMYDGTEKTVSGFETLEYTFDGVTYTVSGLSASVSGTNAGTYTAAVTGTPVVKDSANNDLTAQFNVTTQNGTLTINKKTATVTVDANQSKTYGADDPALTATVTDLVEGDTLSYTLARETGENVGTYAITVTLGSNPNYEVTATNGTFTINKATATVTADAKSKVYGAAEPTLTATVTGLQNGDAANVITYTLSRAEGEDVGEYTITPTGDAEQGNYNVVYVPGTLTITKATATVTAANKTKTYGEIDPALTATVTGLQNGNDASVISYTISRTEGETAGAYAITPSGDAVQGNYDVVFETGILTINPATATVTANNASKIAGNADPTLTATVTGMVNSEPASLISYTVTRETGETAGTYAITPSGNAIQGNYNVTYVPGTFTIEGAVASVTHGETVTYYTSLKDAVAAAQDGDTVTLVADDNVSLTDGSEIEINKPLTITGPVDAEGKPLYTVYGKNNYTGMWNDIFVVSNSGTVTISNLRFAQFGNAVNTGMSRSPILVSTNNHDVVLSNLYFSEFNCSAIHINGGTFEISGCYIDCEKTTGTTYTKGIEIVNAATGTISDATIVNVTCPSTTWTAAIELSGSGDVTVTGCTIESDCEYAIGIAVSENEGTTAGSSDVTISDCTITSGFSIFNDSKKGGVISVSSGTYNGTLMASEDYSILISGGTFDTEVFDEYCAEGYIPKDNEDGTFTVERGWYVTFVDGNEEILDIVPFPENETPVYTGATPKKDTDATYTYTFAGTWTPAFAPVTENATYTANFSTYQNEARIGDVYYAYFADAIAAAAEGDTVTAVRSFTIDASKTGTADRIVVTAPITIDFGEYTMSVPGSLEPTNNWAALYVDADTTVTATTGGIDCLDKENDECGVYTFNVRIGATLTIESGNYHGGGTIAQAQLGTIIVTGGTFTATAYDEPYGMDFALNCSDAAYTAGTAVIEITGGTFVGFDPQCNKAEGENTRFVPANYVALDDGSGSFTVQPGGTVTFDLNGGSGSYGEQRIARGGLVTEPSPVPVKANYQFKEWQLDSAAYDFSAPVTCDFELVAAYDEAVARIGDDYYAYFADAIAAAESGNTITILKDFTISESKTSADDRIVITTPVTIDFGEYTMSAPGSLEPTSNWAALYVDADTTVTATTGGIDCLDKDDGECGVYTFNVRNGATLTIESGNYHGGGTIAQAQLGTIIVTGGTFTATAYDEPYGMDFAFNCSDAAYAAGTASIQITGGTFYGFDPQCNAAEGENTRFVPVNYVAIDDGSGNYTVQSGGTITFDLNGGSGTGDYSEQRIARGGLVTEPDTVPVKTDYQFKEWQLNGAAYDFSTPVTGDIQLVAAYDEAVARIGDEYYATLSGAVAAAQANDTVTLIDDATESRVTISKSLTLDLGGKTFTGRVTIDDGEVTVQNGEIVGRFDAYDNATVTLAADATVNGQAVVWGDGSFGTAGCKTPTLNVYGTITNTGDTAISTNGTDKSGAIINIYDGAVVTSTDDIAIYLPSGNLNIEGGEITGTTAVYAKSGSVTISGGTLTGTGAAAEYSFNGDGGSATGDALVIDTCGYPNGAPGVSVTGGTFISANAQAIASYATEGNTAAAGFVSGGEFGTVLDVSIVEEGSQCTTTLKNENGYYYIVEEVTVTFDPNGGSAVDTVKLPKGEAVAEPTTERTGYTFTAWQLEEENYDFSAAVNGDITLTAAWAPIPYTITWLDDDGTEIGTTTVDYDATPVHADAFRADDENYHYVFTGWSDGTATYATDTNLPIVTGEAAYTAVYEYIARTYGDPVWTWAEDNSSATAAFTTNDDFDTFTLTETAEGEAVTHETTTAETCEETGIETYTATVTFRGAAYTNDKEVVRPALGHDYVYTYAWNSTNSKVTARRVCRNDSRHTDYEAVITTSEVTKEASCTEEGEITYTAKFVHDFFEMQTKKVATPKTHTGEPAWVWLDNETVLVEVRCTGCNELLDTIMAEVTAEITTEPTCTEDGVRTYTAAAEYEGETLTDSRTEPVEKLAHTLSHVDAVDPTCTEDGNIEYWTCENCGKFYSDAEGANEITEITVPAAGHTEVTDAAVDPTCTETGLTEGKHCSVCGEVLVAQEVVEALGHTEVTDAAVAPTCTETGLTEGSHCSVCGEVLVAQEVVAALGHTEVTDAAVAATCTETGLTAGSHCSVCGEVLVAQDVIPATGHAWGEPVWTWDGVSAATATFTCTHNKSHVETVNAEITTETTDAAYTYTATVVFADNTYTDEKTAARTYTVTFVDEDGTTVLAEPQTVVYGEYATEPTAPEKEAYFFKQWNLNGAKYNFTTTAITEDTQLVASWTAALAKVDDTYYRTLSAAIKAVKGTTGKTVEWLGGDTTLSGVFNRFTLGEDQDFTLDLGGSTLTMNGAYFTLNGGRLTVTNGTIDAKGNNSQEFTVNSGELTITESATINGQGNVSPIAVFGPATVNTAGTLTAENSFAIAGNGTAGKGGYTINVTGGTVSSASAAAIYHPNDGTVNISGGKITGATAVYQKSGELNISGGTLTGNGAAADYAYNGNGANATGDALVIDTCGYPGGAPTANVTGGTFISENGDPIGSYAYGDGNDAAEDFVSGGAFSEPIPADFCGTGFHPVTEADANGLYTVETHTLVEHAATAATCTTAGNSAYWSCECGKYFSDEAGENEIELDSWIIQATGHTLTAHAASDATCEAAGNSAYYECSVCHKYFSDAEGTTKIEADSWIIDALGHNYETVVTAPTCTAQGYTTYTCSRCGDTYTADEIDALGHSFGEWVTTDEPTCEDDGSKTRTCSVCSETETEVLPATGHDYTEVVVEPTCTARGYTRHTCENCGDVYENHFVAALGHDYEETVTDPTCTEQGYTTHTCLRCGIRYVDSEVDALGHDMTAHAAVAATCTEDGNSAYWSCATCGKYFSDENGEHEVAEDSWIIAALGHNLTAHAENPATCTETGRSAYWSCSRCGKYFSGAAGETEISADSWIVPALGHDYEDTVTAPTCTERGYTTHTCSRCDDSYTDTFVDALGHSWREAAWNWADDYSAAVLTLTCTACGHSESGTDSAPSYNVTTPASEASSGIGVYTATVVILGKTYTDTEEVSIPYMKLDHPNFTIKGVTEKFNQEKEPEIVTITDSVEGTFQVTYPLGCLVAVETTNAETGEVEYTRLRGTLVDGTDNTYSYTLQDLDYTFDSDIKLIVALKGDVNNDGVINALDAAQVKAASISKLNLNGLGFMTGDVNGDGTINALDAAQVKAASISKLNIVWDQKKPAA